MRLKHIKNADIIVGSSDYTINNPYEYKGSWNKLFNNNKGSLNSYKYTFNNKKQFISIAKES